MRQLDLFADLSPYTSAAPAPDDPAPVAPADVLPGQVGLFEPRSLLLRQARAAVAEARLDDACTAVEVLLARCPDDPQIAREAAEVRALRERLARLDAPHVRHRAAALLAMAKDLGERAHEPRASLRRWLLGRVAAEIQRQHGDGGELDGRLAGEYLFEAGDLEAAQTSLAAAVAVRREARPVYLLADVTFVRGDVRVARRLYLDALLRDPFEAALRDVRDEAVRELPSAVRYQVEIETEPEAWSAPAGVVLGVLPRPAPDDTHALPQPSEVLPLRRREALGRARAFVEALATSGTSPTIELRRKLKALSPQLFAAYMTWWVRRNPA